jgi:AbiU2
MLGLAFGATLWDGRATPGGTPKISVLRRRRGASQILWEFDGAILIAWRLTMTKKFVDELKIFHAEETTAQQCFFASLAVTEALERNRGFLRLANTYPVFWVSTHHALVAATFVALGRIFDQKSSHNVDALMRAVSTDISEFTADAMKARLMKKGLSSEEATRHASQVKELTAIEVRKLKKKIAHWRRVYEATYKYIRNKIFAHKELSATEEIEALYAKTSVDELKELFKFLSSLRLALWAAYEVDAGTNLDWYDTDLFIGERVRQEGEKVLTG